MEGKPEQFPSGKRCPAMKGSKAVPSDEKHSENSLAREVRRQLGSHMNRRALNGLPAFRVDPATPLRFEQMLSDLDRAEQARSTK